MTSYQPNEEAIIDSGGQSSPSVKNLVIRMITENSIKGSFLDFGAGKGALLMRLQGMSGVTSVSGVDFLSRPHQLSDSVRWWKADLNIEFSLNEKFDAVICSEVIEHLENPRAAFRTLKSLLNPGGILVLTMPNQESIRSYLALIFGGHFVYFIGANYPAHITALLKIDLGRLCTENNFGSPHFYFSGNGGIPKMPKITWQKISMNILTGRLFSDNIGMVARLKTEKGS